MRFITLQVLLLFGEFGVSLDLFQQLAESFKGSLSLHILVRFLLLFLNLALPNLGGSVGLFRVDRYIYIE